MQIELNNISVNFCCAGYVPNTFEIAVYGYDYESKSMKNFYSKSDDYNIPNNGIQAVVDYSINFNGLKDFQISIKITATYFRLCSIFINTVPVNIASGSN